MNQKQQIDHSININKISNGPDKRDEAMKQENIMWTKQRNKELKETRDQMDSAKKLSNGKQIWLSYMVKYHREEAKKQ